MKNFLHDELWIGHSGDDKDDDPCLNQTLLQESDEFYSLSCLCNANSSILVASAPCTTVSSSPCWPNPHLYKLLQLPAPAQHLHSKLLGGFQWNCYVEEDKLRLKLSSVTAGLHLLTMDNTCTRNVGYYGTPKKICPSHQIERTFIP